MPPNMTPTELDKWASKQIDAAVARGVNPIDAAAAVKRFLAKLPPGADPDHYVPHDGGEADVTRKEAIDDARADWYGKVEPRVARLLDARSVE
jgi:hypothetical protein